MDFHFKSLTRLILNNKLPNLFFSGISGSGKTTLAIKIKNYLYNNDDIYSSYIINGSEKNKLSIFKDEIKKFCEYRNINVNNSKINKKMLIIDEADNLSMPTQYYLQSLMKKYHNSICFCIICNFKDNINDIIQSLCVSYVFKPFCYDEYKKILLSGDDIKIQENKIKDIYNITKKDLRKGVNLINIINNNEIDNIYLFFNYPTQENITNIYNILHSNDSLNNKYLLILNIIQKNNILLKYILQDFLKYYIDINKKYDKDIIIQIINIESYLINDNNMKLHLLSFISLF